MEDSNLGINTNIDYSYMNGGSSGSKLAAEDAAMGLPLSLDAQTAAKQKVAGYVKQSRANSSTIIGENAPLPASDYYYPSNDTTGSRTVEGVNLFNTGVNRFPIGIAQYAEAQKQKERQANIMAEINPMAGLDLAVINDLNNSLFTDKQMQVFSKIYQDNIPKLKAKGLTTSQSVEQLNNSWLVQKPLLQFKSFANTYNPTLRKIFIMNNDDKKNLNYSPETLKLSNKLIDTLSGQDIDIDKLSQLSYNLNKRMDIDNLLNNKDNGLLKDFEKNLETKLELAYKGGSYDIWQEKVQQIKSEVRNGIKEYAQYAMGDGHDKGTEKAIDSRLDAMQKQTIKKWENVSKSDYGFEAYKKRLQNENVIYPNKDANTGQSKYDLSTLKKPVIIKPYIQNGNKQEYQVTKVIKSPNNTWVSYIQPVKRIYSYEYQIDNNGVKTKVKDQSGNDIITGVEYETVGTPEIIAPDKVAGSLRTAGVQFSEDDNFFKDYGEFTHINKTQPATQTQNVTQPQGEKYSFKGKTYTKQQLLDAGVPIEQALSDDKITKIN
jgi:hypothetical protein